MCKRREQEDFYRQLIAGVNKDETMQQCTPTAPRRCSASFVTGTHQTDEKLHMRLQREPVKYISM
ncbi:hypothetical protein T265_06157 [Opisthorchis viverrini]|uniref:Uncharacterized protein n=1 Tax=Opisthorchis viverrini TaxID=6198 RepID=A0A074ZHC3_OPIVI|nr:hypothetical protein T265_06157 [Opisthorchis viverrini]KER26656.1 hypothetical protein T265_06157 [Opisthorchis viverrini]